MRCLFLLDSASGRDLSDCDCPPRCRNFVHEATVSSSRLSDITIKSETIRRYVNAVGTRNRIASSLLTDVLDHLEKLQAMYQRLRAVLDVDFIEHKTSLPEQIHDCISTMVQTTRDSIEEFSSQIVDEFTEYYEENIDLSVKQLLHSAKSLLKHHFFIANIDVNDTDNFNVSLLKKIFDYRDAFCTNFEVVNMSLNNGANFSTWLFVDETCFDQHYYYCSSKLATIRYNDVDVERLVALYRTIAMSARTVLRCFPMYRTFLAEVRSWLKQARTINSSLPLPSADRQYVRTELDHQLNWLKTMSRTFAEKTVVKSFVHTV